MGARLAVLALAVVAVAACGEDGGSSTRPSPSTGRRAGAGNVTEVHLELLTVSVENGRGVARVEWTSGVAPCHVLDHTDADRDGDRITVRVFEGGDPDAVCIELAERHTADVDLGLLPPGRYTVEARGVEGPLREELEVP